MAANSNCLISEENLHTCILSLQKSCARHGLAYLIMKKYFKEYAILLYHEAFIYRHLRNNGFLLCDGSKVYCKDSKRFWILLGEIRLRINNILMEYPEAGKIWLFDDLWFNVLR